MRQRAAIRKGSRSLSKNTVMTPVFKPRRTFGLKRKRPCFTHKSRCGAYTGHRLFISSPSVGGRAFSYSYWQQICEIPNVVAIKSAPFNRYLTLDVVRACALSSRCDEITLYTEMMTTLLLICLHNTNSKKTERQLQKGFKGGLLGHWCIWTHTVAKLFEQIKDRTATPELLTLAAEITDANGVVFDAANGFAGCIPGIHEILRRQGLLKGTWCINPNEVLSPGQSAEIDRIYEMYPHLNDDEFVKDFLKRHNADF